MNLSDAGIDLIKRSEGLRLIPYLDQGGFWTVGYGHKMSGAELEAGRNKRSIDQATADALLASDVQWASSEVNRMVRVPLSQGQFDALVDFVFNLGSGRLATSTLLKMLNQGDYDGAGKQLLHWEMAGGNVQLGLKLRREAELAMWEEK